MFIAPAMGAIAAGAASSGGGLGAVLGIGGAAAAAGGAGYAASQYGGGNNYGSNTMGIRTDDPINFMMDFGLGPVLDYFNQQENQRRMDAFSAQQRQLAERLGRNLGQGYDEAMWGRGRAGLAGRTGPDVSGFDLYESISSFDPSQPHQVQRRADWLEMFGFDPETGAAPTYQSLVGLTGDLGAASADYWGGAGQRFEDIMDPTGMNTAWGKRTTAGQTAGADILTGARGRETTSAATGAGILGGYGTRTLAGQEAGGNIVGGYGTRLGTSMGMIEGAGAQERRDINQQYGSFGAQQQADMAARGLTGTTVAPSMQAGVERERRDALGRLDERLLQQRTGLYGQLSGEALGAAERNLLVGAGLSGQELAAQGMQQGVASQLSGDTLGMMYGQQQFGAGLTADQLSQQQAMAAAQLGYRDRGFQAMQADQLNYGMMPIQQGLAGPQAMADFWTNSVQSQPPFMM